MTKLLYPVAAFCLAACAMVFVVERLNGAPNMPPATLALLMAGMLTLTAHNVTESDHKLAWLNGTLFACYLVGGVLI